MTHSTRCVCLVAVVCMMTASTFAADAVPAKLPAPAKTAASAAAAPSPQPTTDAVRQLLTKAQYVDVVKVVTKITTSHDWQQKKSDAYDLYTMKGEAHLHMKENALAAASFDMAAKAVSDNAAADKILIDKGTDEKPAEQAVMDRFAAERVAAGVARANSYLIKHSTGLFYVPKATANQRVAGASPNDHLKIDILSPDTRKTALTALWTDEKNAAATTVTAATDTDTKSIRAVMDATSMMLAIRDCDFGANGNDDDTTKTAAMIAEHGRDLIQEMLDKMLQRLDIISTDALTVDSSKIGLPGGGSSDRWHKHGLEGKQGDELKAMLKNVGDITKAIKTLNDGLSPDKGYFDVLSKDAKSVHDQADTLLKTDFSQTYANRETAMKKGA